MEEGAYAGLPYSVYGLCLPAFFGYPPFHHLPLEILLTGGFPFDISLILINFFTSQKKWTWCLKKCGVNFSFLPCTMGLQMHNLVSLSFYFPICKLGQFKEPYRVVESNRWGCSVWTIKGHSNARHQELTVNVAKVLFGAIELWSLCFIRGFVTLSILAPWCCALWPSFGSDTEFYRWEAWVH